MKKYILTEDEVLELRYMKRFNATKHVFHENIQRKLRLDLTRLTIKCNEPKIFCWIKSLIEDNWREVNEKY